MNQETDKPDYSRAVEQSTFPFYDERVLFSERIQIGSTASEILEETLRLLPAIDRISYVTYDLFTSASYAVETPSLRWISKSDFSINQLRLLSATLRPNMVLGISSQVLLKDGSCAHIPMVDLSCKQSENNLAKATRVLKRYQEGFILNSGNSYHFWGLRLLSNEQWEKFLDYCQSHSAHLVSGEYELLFDLGYIGESRRRGFSVLRIFNYPPKKPIEPYVIKLI